MVIKVEENKILKSIKPVIKLAEHVRIIEENIEAVCKDFNSRNVQYWMAASPFNLSDLSDKEKLNFIFVFNSINFCYWGKPKWTIEYEGNQYDGAWGMIGCLRRAIDNKVPILQAKYLAKISEGELKEILKGNILIPLFEERLKILQENGKVLEEKYKGDFASIVEKAKKDTLNLLEIIISDFPSFNDVAFYKEYKVLFYKRVQLLISDIYRTFEGENYDKLKNIELLTAFSDYKIPQVLRKLKILEYSPELASKIDNQIPILSGSEEEIEIRANTIWAIEMMKEKIKPKIPNITSMDIDSYLWLLGQNKSPDDKPYHLTRTIFY